MGLWDQTVRGNQPDPSSDRCIPQDAGEIFIDGAPVYENKQVKAQMAYIPDEPFYFYRRIHWNDALFPGNVRVL